MNQLPKRILDQMKRIYLNRDINAKSDSPETLLIGLIQSPLLPEIAQQGT